MDTTEDDTGDGDDPLVGAGVVEVNGDEEPEEVVETSEVDDALAGLPEVAIRLDLVPADLQPGHFIGEMVNRVIGATPVNLHRAARERQRSAPAAQEAPDPA